MLERVEPPFLLGSANKLQGSFSCLLVVCTEVCWNVPGYFTSRAASKGFIRQATSYLQIARQLEFVTGKAGHSDILDEAVALLQHHDSITGTEKQHVTNDYHKRLSKGTTAHKLSGLHHIIPWKSLVEAFILGHKADQSLCLAEDLLCMFAGWMHAERFINEALAHLVYGPKGAAKTLQQALSSQLLKLFSPTLPSRQLLQEGEEGDLLLVLHQCPFLNVSVCEASLKYSLKEEAFLVVVYNPLAWPRKAPVQVPMTDKNKAAWAIKGIQALPYYMTLAHLAGA